ncbi:MAG: FHA domain-containing protein [Deltaproteobacteria bacterium]|nr:FHA domain-containing protein [Deltaproteobacteria bacterium]
MRFELHGPEDQKAGATISSAPLSVGRDGTNDLVIAERTVSRHQCRIWMEADGRILIEDSESRYGTFINGQLLQEPRSIRSGDTIRFGDWEGRVFDEELAAQATVEVHLSGEATGETTIPPAATRKTRLIKLRPEPASSPTYVIVLALAAVLATALIVILLLDSSF